MAGAESQHIINSLNGLDWVIVGVIGFSVVISITRGFMREVISLVTWVLAIWVSFHYTQAVSTILEGYIEADMLRMMVSVGILFFATLIAGVFVNVVIGGVMLRSRLSVADRFLGMAFGATRGVLLVTLAVMLGGMTMVPQSDWWGRANLVPYFEHSASWLATFLPEKVVNFVGKDGMINSPGMRSAFAMAEKYAKGAPHVPATALANNAQVDSNDSK